MADKVVVAVAKAAGSALVMYVAMRAAMVTFKLVALIMALPVEEAKVGTSATRGVAAVAVLVAAMVVAVVAVVAVAAAAAMHTGTKCAAEAILPRL